MMSWMSHEGRAALLDALVWTVGAVLGLAFVWFIWVTVAQDAERVEPPALATCAEQCAPWYPTPAYGECYCDLTRKMPAQ